MNKNLLLALLACFVLGVCSYVVWAYTDFGKTNDMSAAVNNAQKDGVVSQTVFEEVALKVPANTAQENSKETYTALESGTIVSKERGEQPQSNVFNWMHHLFENIFR